MKTKHKIDKHVKIVEKMLITDITYPTHEGFDLQKIRVN